MKEYTQKLKQLSRTIEKSDRTREKVFVDNRVSPMQNVIQEMKRSGGKKKSGDKEPSVLDRSLANLMHYGATWYSDFRGTDDELRVIMQAFIRTYPYGIRGHHSGNSNSGTNDQTDHDLAVFYAWYKANKKGSKKKKSGKRRYDSDDDFDDDSDFSGGGKGPFDGGKKPFGGGSGVMVAVD